MHHTATCSGFSIRNVFNTETRKLTCAYDANRNGWSADAFHKRLDKKGPAVLLAKSKGGAVFGGYNAKACVT
jgi:hypothetical protein